MKKTNLHKFSSNLGLKIIALVFSAILWLAVGFIDDPVKSEAFSNIPFTLKNEEIITNDGKKFKIMDDIDSVRVVVRAPRSILNNINRRDITAVVDLRQRDSNTGVVPIKAVVSGYEESLKITTETNPNNILIKVENEASKSFPISVMTENNPRDGYELGEMKVNPERVEISGSESTIEDIQKVVAKIDVIGISEDCEIKASLHIFDGNGNEMDQNGLQMNLGDKGVSVNVQILPSKKVKLEFEVSGNPAEGYYYTGLSSVPETIKVYGTKEALKGLDSIKIPAKVIDISGVDSKREYTIDISPYLPEGVALTDETANNVIVTVMVEKDGTRTFLLQVGSIRINNLAENLSATMEVSGDLEVYFTGKEELLEKLDIKNAASIDLRDYTEPGTYEVPVYIAVDSDVVLMNNPVVTVTLAQKAEENESTGTTE
ncbi:CdaR family protein [Mediterraneibacter agrestimuris]|uniref:CdaR family protein n=1 Tax=Mediterraneibacter agrestimuris TaxID=2941333 RepID=UPI00203FD093|nr:CdaR family protein [Mediterraneibacter agrestimuris]